MSRDQNAGQNHKIKIGNILQKETTVQIFENNQKIKIPFINKLTED